MALDEFTYVRIRTDRCRDRGVDHGTFGVILDVYGEDAYEVEFVGPDGDSIAWFAVLSAEVATAEALVGSTRPPMTAHQDWERRTAPLPAGRS